MDPLRIPLTSSEGSQSSRASHYDRKFWSNGPKYVRLSYSPVAWTREAIGWRSLVHLDDFRGSVTNLVVHQNRNQSNLTNDWSDVEGRQLMSKIQASSRGFYWLAPSPWPSFDSSMIFRSVTRFDSHPRLSAAASGRCQRHIWQVNEKGENSGPGYLMVQFSHSAFPSVHWILLSKPRTV